MSLINTHVSWRQLESMFRCTASNSLISFCFKRTPNIALQLHGQSMPSLITTGQGIVLPEFWDLSSLSSFPNATHFPFRCERYEQTLLIILDSRIKKLWTYSICAREPATVHQTTSDSSYAYLIDDWSFSFK